MGVGEVGVLGGSQHATCVHSFPLLSSAQSPEAWCPPVWSPSDSAQRRNLHVYSARDGEGHSPRGLQGLGVVGWDPGL